MREAIAEIDLGALRHNLALARSRAPSSRVVAVVKANAYGHGLERVVPALEDADILGVACSEEALKLREAGVSRPILLLEGVFEPAEIELCWRHDFWAVVHHVSQVEMLESARPERPVQAWLKIDTGMHRLGFHPEEAAGIWERLQQCPAVAPGIRLMSHLANADDREDPITIQQVETWREATASLKGEASFANSAGVLGWPDTHLQWVRPGVMLYGISPFQDSVGEQEGLRPVMSLRTRLIAVKRLRRGDRVGYSGTWYCPEDLPLGIAAIGYGDGYPRHAPSGTRVLVDGRTVALAGRVSMDMICLDLRKHPLARVGAAVTLWGPELPVEAVARDAGTIAYELLCGVTPRVYFRVKDDGPASQGTG